VPDMFYYIIWQLSLPLLFYKNSGTPLVVIAGSIIWALVMGALLPVLLARINFRLKL
jgi:heparan-alpha-glucosaminide N-acetyltransferase